VGKGLCFRDDPNLEMSEEFFSEGFDDLPEDEKEG